MRSFFTIWASLLQYCDKYVKFTTYLCLLLFSIRSPQMSNEEFFTTVVPPSTTTAFRQLHLKAMRCYLGFFYFFIFRSPDLASFASPSVCVCVRERERERELY